MPVWTKGLPTEKQVKQKEFLTNVNLGPCQNSYTNIKVQFFYTHTFFNLESHKGYNNRKEFYFESWTKCEVVFFFGKLTHMLQQKVLLASTLYFFVYEKLLCLSVSVNSSRGTKAKEIIQKHRKKYIPSNGGLPRNFSSFRLKHFFFCSCFQRNNIVLPVISQSHNHHDGQV